MAVFATVEGAGRVRLWPWRDLVNACPLSAGPPAAIKPSSPSHPTETAPMRAAALSLCLVGLAVAADDKPAAKLNVPPEGFTALFNGKDLTNWQGLVEIKDRIKLMPDKEAYEK